MKNLKIDLPDSLMPDEEFREMAKLRDKEYKRLYILLMENAEDITPTEAIAIIAKVHVEHLALMVGTKVTEYDKQILCGVLERYITSIVFVEK